MTTANSSADSSGERFHLGSMVVTQPVGSEMVVLDLETGLYHSLNEVGALLYEHLDNGATRDELIEVVTTHFDVMAEQAAHDIDAFLATEIESGMVLSD
jgi:hypothetical protein